MRKIITYPSVDSTNAAAKKLALAGEGECAVAAAEQTAGRGRLARSWQSPAGEGLWVSLLLRPRNIPAQCAGGAVFVAALAMAEALCAYGPAKIKWPNDLLLNGKKVVGILCEGAPDGHSVLSGIGINLAQDQAYFDAAGLPHGTSLALQGVKVDLEVDPEWLAQYMTDFGFDRELYTYEVEGFAPYRERYKARCVNLGRRVTYDGGAGTAVDVDEEGRLIVEGENGETRVFTGEVSVQGIYGAV